MDSSEMLCELNRAISNRAIPETERNRLRTLAMTPGSAATFSAELAKVEASAPPHVPGEEPDAWEANRNNPSMPLLMRACKLTPDDVRKHGPKAGGIVRNLADLITATAQRGG